MKRSKIIGLTGGFGTGKSTVAGMFRKLGAKVIDCDRIGHAILKNNKIIRQRLRKEFGTLTRSGLGKIVFSSPQKLKKLNRIMHPAIIKEVKNRLRSIKSGLAVIDAPLLIEAGLDKIIDYLVVVRANRAAQFKRAGQKTKLTKKEIKLRISAQLSLSKKLEQADFVIDNSKTKTNTKKQVKRIMESLA